MLLNSGFSLGASHCFETDPLVLEEKEVPFIEPWGTEVTETLHPDRVRFLLKDKPDMFEKVRQTLICFLRGFMLG